MPSFDCSACGGVHTIDDLRAKEHCRRLMEKMETSGRLDLAIPRDEADRRLSTEPLFGDARGQMFGVLVCAPPLPGGKEVILKAFSGQYNGIWMIPGWASPLLAPEDFEAAVRTADPAIKHLSAEIAKLAPGIERTGMIDKRRSLSQNHMREIHDMYTIRNFKGESKSLFDLFAGKTGIPAGTGDCCAPKLLNEAIRLGLKPISLAEFFWGRENRSETKQHRHFYEPCDDKCRPILGFMLCGADDAD